MPHHDVTKTVVVERDETPKSLESRKLETPGHSDDIKVVVMTGLMVILVRSGRTFLQVLLASLIGVVAGSSVPVVSDVLPPAQFGERFVAALYLASISALVTALQNAVELFAKIDARFPEWRA
jgi:hypothetical protein